MDLVKPPRLVELERIPEALLSDEEYREKANLQNGYMAALARTDDDPVYDGDYNQEQIAYEHEPQPMTVEAEAHYRMLKRKHLRKTSWWTRFWGWARGR